MIIAVNTRLLQKDRLEGIGWFTHETLKRITRSHPEHTFLFLFDRPYAPEFIYGDNIKPIIVPPPTRHPLLWYIWFEYSLPWVIKKYNADMFLSLDGYMPLHLNIPSLITIHDINFHHRPQDLPRSSRNYYRKYFPLFARHSDRITTVSEYSREDIITSYQIDPDKIDVVYNGVNEIFVPLNPEEKFRIRESLTRGCPYFHFVGSMHPRKNLANLLKAFDLFRNKLNMEYKLIIVGEKMFMTGDLEKSYSSMSYPQEVIFTGRLSPDKLHEVLGASEGLTFVPLFEGFGIPLLEAMRCEVPILTSNVTSLPEVASNAAVYADPKNIEEISDGMMLIATDEALRARLIRAGKERSEAFSWNITANSLWESIKQVLDKC